MAKAKKSTPAKAKEAPKAKKSLLAPAAPMVDTTLAASVAAKQIAAGLAPPLAAPPAGKESVSFKQLKAGLTGPTGGGGLDSILDKTAQPGSRKADAPFAGPRGPGGTSSGRNQTFGADVNRTGVPRRTSGG